MSNLICEVRVLTCRVSVVLLAGCAAFQSSTDLQSQQTPLQAPRSSSALSGDLLYVSSTGKVFVVSYPSGQRQFTLTFGSANPTGMCVDASGNVFVVGESGTASTIYEYAHGGNEPIAALDDPGQGALCSVDPSSGNLAVVNVASPSGHHGNVAIYAGGAGAPTIYSAPPFIDELSACAYDTHGNLFVAGASDSIDSVLGEMRSGSSSFTQLSISPQLEGAAISLQWNKSYLAWTSALLDLPASVYQLSISGTKATVDRTTRLKSHSNNTRIEWPYTWIYGKKIVAPLKRGAGIWSYPKGGRIKSSITFGNAQGVAVVISPGT